MVPARLLDPPPLGAGFFITGNYVAGQPVLFPIRIDDAVMDTTEQWAHDIRRTRHISDFTRWKEHDAYSKALDRLLRDLRIEKT
jgi:hypothetical protein